MSKLTQKIVWSSDEAMSVEYPYLVFNALKDKQPIGFYEYSYENSDLAGYKARITPDGKTHFSEEFVLL